MATEQVLKHNRKKNINYFAGIGAKILLMIGSLILPLVGLELAIRYQNPWGWLLLGVGVTGFFYTIYGILKMKGTTEPNELDETVTAAKEGIQELEAVRNAAIEKLKTLESQSTQDKQEINTLKQQIERDDKEIDRLREDLIQVYKDLEIQRIQVENLKGSKDYFRISKLHANASFVISVIACFVGLGLLTAAAVFAIRERDFRVAIVPAIGGAVANFIAATVFWVHNKSAQQLNRYYDSLHEIEVFLSSTKIIEKISMAEGRDAAYQKILDELFNIQKIKAAKDPYPKRRPPP
ncbi:MAG: hypothetical protein LBB75_06030 [Oscillospiraceae bacterium]|nr:hypothetical protein [Oscillospiraceae bacterium]